MNSQKISKHVKLGFCEDKPEHVWKQSLKGFNKTGPPKILGQHGKVLKFIASILANNLTSIFLHEASLDTEIKIKLEPKEGESSIEDELVPSTINSDN